ncbi:MAG TPA: metal-dependent hydrolase [Bryobacteraceae bacterium]|nr:metal-dependent hydrolase [Bryobacteraceae bacterium]
MDNLTHTAVGLFLSRAGLNRWTPRATPILLVAANLPDVDILAALGGSLSYLHYHRHWTHSLLAMPLMALLAVGLVRVVLRTPLAWLRAFAVALVGVASHLLLDLTNTYGVRLLLPFSSEWLRLDIAGFPDPWIWTILLLGLLGPFLSRLVGSEIGSGGARTRYYGRGGAIFALSLLTLDLGGRAVLHARAVNTLQSRLYWGMPPLRVAACPTLTNPWRWNGIVETEGFYARAPVNLLAEFDPAHALILDKPEPSPALDQALATPAFREFLRFSQFPAWRVWPDEKIENGLRVEALDLRFGSPASPAFFARARLDGNGKVIESSFHFR